MKTVVMSRDLDYRPRAGVIVAYVAGTRYERVPEAAVRAIVAAGAGEIERKARQGKDAGKDAEQ